jgi:hypothetical protein
MFIAFMSLHIFFCIDVCLYILFFKVEVVPSLILFWIQMSLKFIKIILKWKSFPILFYGHGPKPSSTPESAQLASLPFFFCVAQQAQSVSYSTPQPHPASRIRLTRPD